ncbi:MAG: nuclear transport factor 2 family protein [Rhodanobacter sp.]
MADSEKRILIEQFIDAYNRFDVGGMSSLLTPDVLFENVDDGQVTAATSGIAEFQQLAERSKALFSERKQTITALKFRPASVLASIAWRGVFAIDVPNGPVAGTVIELAGESEFEFAGERISRIVDRS